MTELGRYGATTTWITVALLGGPLGATRLLDRVRELDGLVRPGTFYGAVARLERLSIIAPVTIEGRAGYRLVPPIPGDRSRRGLPS